LVALVRLGSGAEARVLAHRPELAAVHRRLHAAREREVAGLRRVAARVVGSIRAFDLDLGVGLELGLAELGGLGLPVVAHEPVCSIRSARMSPCCGRWASSCSSASSATAAYFAQRPTIARGDVMAADLVQSNKE